MLISTGFLADAKVQQLSTTGILLFLSLILLAGESNQSQVEVSHESLRSHSRVKSESIQSQLALLQSLQLVTIEKIEPFLNRIEEKRKRETAATKNLCIIPVQVETDVEKTAAAVSIKKPEQERPDLLRNSFHPDVKKISDMTQEKFGNRISKYATEVFTHFGSAKNFFDWLVDLERSYAKSPPNMSLVSWVEVCVKKRIGVIRESAK